MAHTKLTDDDLDMLLERAAASPGVEDSRVDAALAALLTEARAYVPPRSRRGRRFLAVAVGLGVSGTLLAATTMSAVWLRIPPFQELPGGWSRTTEYIPLEWVSGAGEEGRCRVYLELERARPGDIDALDAAIANRDWTGFGQEIYDSLPDAPTGPDVEGDVSTAANPLIRDFAVSVTPEIGDDVDGPTVSALATTCRTDI